VSLRDLGDWNQRFQEIVEKMRKFDEYTPLPERVHVTRNLIHLAHDFIYSSATYGKIIISELYLPVSQKTIRPSSLGGVAGGEKYIVHNIIFKFAVDHLHLYQSDEAAAKVAGHELKGLLSYFNTNVKVCLPLMALVDYRGFRLSAISMLPISPKTVIYGSSDCGHRVFQGDDKLIRELKKAAKRQNIKEHMAGLHVQTSGNLFGPIDMEGHVGSDGRHYLVDFSRVLPPQTPKRNVPMGHLFQLLRPEFVKDYKSPLCSDAFTGFIRGHRGEEDHNREIVEATNHLLVVIIPEFAKELSAMMKEALNKGQHMSNFRLTEMMHRRGINMRFLGVVRHHIIEKAANWDCQLLLLVEMAARVIKNNLRKRLREKMKSLKLPVDEPYRRLVIDYLNLVFGESDASQAYWATEVKTQITVKYVRGLTSAERAAEFPLKTNLSQFSRMDIDGKYIMFMRVQKMSGLKFTTRLNNYLKDNPNNWVPRGPQPFDDTDLKTIDPRVKHMNIIPHGQGYIFKIEGELRWDKDPFTAQRFFQMALEKFEEALDTDPSNAETLSYRAEVFSKLIEAEFLDVMETKYFEDHPRVQQAKDYFERAINAHASVETLFAYAQFLEKCGNYQMAEECYLSALEKNSSHVATLKEYGNFLSDLGLHHEAEKFYVRCSEATKIVRSSVLPTDSLPFISTRDDSGRSSIGLGVGGVGQSTTSSSSSSSPSSALP
jgi:tetratricopeptide (TPR) repeat protein